MSNEPAAETNKFYVSLSITELQALGKVSGEAMRVYLAIASFCFGTDVSCFPRWKAVREKIGKNITDRRLKELAVKLEEAKLIRRYTKQSDGKRYFYLPLKAKAIKQRKQEEEGGAQKEHSGGSKRAPEGGSKRAPKGGSKRAPIKNRIKDKLEHVSNNEIIDNSFNDNNTDKTKTVKLTNGTYRSIGQLTNTFLENAWFITFHSKEDQKIILKFLDENGYGIITRSLEKIIKQEEEE